MKPIYIGTAGWSIPKSHGDKFPGGGTHLERYGKQLTAVEVNSSFYRDHQEATYSRWRDSVPEEFRFSVKLPRRYTHEARLDCNADALRPSVEAIKGLGEKLGVILVQLPPKLAFQEELARKFFGSLRELYDGQLALEPRHPSWGQMLALPLYQEMKISKVMADPEPCPAEDPRFHFEGNFGYRRLHGSPETYRSTYSENYLNELYPQLRHGVSWCIFDNTTFGHATANALQLHGMANLNIERKAS
jgi:uncharacterized protein YecE (DUF72 family)